MSDLLQHIQSLIGQGEVRISEHGYDELAADSISAREAVAGVADAVVVEEYAAYAKGPAVLVLQRDESEQVIHVLWGIPAGKSTPAVLVTAYRPDPLRWSVDFLRRRP